MHNHRSRLGVAAGLLGIGLLLAATAATHAALQVEVSLDALADQAAQGAMAGGKCKAIAVGIEENGQQALKFYGDTGNIGAPTADTEFEIGSITKTFTATLLALADQRATAQTPGSPVMRLEDPLQDYAPAGITVPSYQGTPITLLDLATHTAGLPRNVPVAKTSHLQPPKAWAFLNSYKLTRAPGQQFEYSNLGYGMLALAIARKANRDIDDLIANQIAGPLGMDDTMIALDPARQKRLARGYRANGTEAGEGLPSWPAMNGAGALHSTLADLMRYLHYQLGEAKTPLDSVLPALQQWRRPGPHDSGVGLGWQMHKLANGVDVIGKDGATAGFASVITFAPSSHTGAVILANRVNCPVLQMGAQIIGPLNGTAVLPVAPTFDGDPGDAAAEQ
ncbi:MAG TPA: serine hydrolase [Methylomirabilota bacterium]|nr:serine hydrolase [Methylomirabilota bacterium]